MRRPWLSISGLPAVQHCPASAATSEGEPRNNSEKSLVGTAVHAVRENIDRGKDPDVEFEALTRGVDPERVAALTEGAAPRAEGSDPEVEIIYTVNDADGMPLHTIPGHIDSLVVQLSDGPPPVDYPGTETSIRWALVHDDKSGDPEFQTPTAIDPQLTCYALAVLDAYGLDAVLFRKLYMQIGNSEIAIDHAWIHPGNVESRRRWIDSLIIRAHEQRALAPADREYRPEPTYDACLGCAGMYRCPGFRTAMNNALAFFRANTSFPVETDQDAIALYGARAWINAAARKSADAGKALALRVHETGPIIIDGDYQLSINASGNVAKTRRPPLREE